MELAWMKSRDRALSTPLRVIAASPISVHALAQTCHRYDLAHVGVRFDRTNKISDCSQARSCIVRDSSRWPEIAHLLGFTAKSAISVHETFTPSLSPKRPCPHRSVLLDVLLERLESAVALKVHTLLVLACSITLHEFRDAVMCIPQQVCANFTCDRKRTVAREARLSVATPPALKNLIVGKPCP